MVSTYLHLFLLSSEDVGNNIYYFNFVTGQSMWEHPCDEFYKNLLKQERQKKAAAATKPASKKRPSAAKKSQNKKGQSSGDSNSVLGKKGIGGDLSGKPVSEAIKNESLSTFMMFDYITTYLWLK